MAIFREYQKNEFPNRFQNGYLLEAKKRGRPKINWTRRITGSHVRKYFKSRSLTDEGNKDENLEAKDSSVTFCNREASHYFDNINEIFSINSHQLDSGGSCENKHFNTHKTYTECFQSIQYPNYSKCSITIGLWATD